jgi:BirA family biotin operon repressor/biotin-[acetyl-CoA-carboxylase] ligase
MILKKFVYKNVNSTNDIAIKIIKNSNNKCGLVIADNQKKGRGRYGKKWISFKGNIFVTFFFNIDKNNLSLKKMTYINCFLIKRLLSSYCNKRISIKAPNDLLVNKKKISGILQEIIKKNKKKYMIVGIGINLIKNPNITNYPTTNLLEVSKRKVNKKEIILRLKKIYEKFIPKLDLYTTGKIL